MFKHPDVHWDLLRIHVQNMYHQSFLQWINHLFTPSVIWHSAAGNSGYFSVVYLVFIAVCSPFLPLYKKKTTIVFLNCPFKVPQQRAELLHESVGVFILVSVWWVALIRQLCNLLIEPKCSFQNDPNNIRWYNHVNVGSVHSKPSWSCSL